MGRTAIVLLTLHPHREQMEFFRRLGLSGCDVYAVIDDNSWEGPDIAGVRTVQIPEQSCFDLGYFDFNRAIEKQNHCSAWDKALCHFCCFDRSYANVWLIEDDVFIPTITAIADIDRKYGQADIISAGNEINRTGERSSWSWWKAVPEFALPLPWAKSMVCAVRLSRKMLDSIHDLVTHKRSIIRSRRCHPFIEFVFHTLALHQQLRVVVADELRGIVWRKDWDLAELKPSGLYHPIKQRERHELLRQQMACLSGEAHENGAADSDDDLALSGSYLLHAV